MLNVKWKQFKKFRSRVIIKSVKLRHFYATIGIHLIKKLSNKRKYFTKILHRIV